MKITVLLSLLLCFSTFVLAQDRPPWVDKDLPMAGNAANQGEYKVVSGEGTTEVSARQNAITAFIQMRNYEMGVTVSADQNYSMNSSTNSAFGNGVFGSYDGSYGNEGEQNAGQARVRADERNMSFRIIDTYSEKSLLMGNVKTWLLIWVPSADGNGMNPPKFVVVKGGGMKLWSHGGAMVRSLVLPGWGQLYKGQRLKGILFMTGTLGAIVLGGIMRGIEGTVLAEEKQVEGDPYIYRDPDGRIVKTEPSYKTEKVTNNIMSNTLFAIGGGLYVVQLLDALISGDPVAPMPGQVGRYRYIGQNATIQLQPWVAMQQPLGMPNGNSVVGAQLRIDF